MEIKDEYSKKLSVKEIVCVLEMINWWTEEVNTVSSPYFT